MTGDRSNAKRTQEDAVRTSPWRAIPGYPGYEITPRGLVRTTNGYTLTRRGSQVRLTRDGERVTAAVAALLDLAFPAQELVVATPSSREARQIAALKRGLRRLAEKLAGVRSSLFAELVRMQNLSLDQATDRADLLAEIRRLQGRVGELARAALAAEGGDDGLARANAEQLSLAKTVAAGGGEVAALRARVADLEAELAVYRVAENF